MEKIKMDIFAGNEQEQRQCEKHGAYVAKGIRVQDRMIWTSCPKCMEEKRIQEDVELSRTLIQQKIQADAERIMGQAAIPPRFINRTLDNFRAETDEQQKALKICRAFVERWERVRENGKSIILIGKPGTGKTHLAIGIAQGLIKQGKTAVYTRSSSIVQAVKESFGNREKTERQVYEDFCKPDLLIIDEVGRQYGTDAETLMLFEVINRRYEQCKPMIVISNLDQTAFTGYMGEATVSRLREGGALLAFSGEDMRLKIDMLF